MANWPQINVFILCCKAKCIKQYPLGFTGELEDNKSLSMIVVDWSTWNYGVAWKNIQITLQIPVIVQA